MCLFLYTVEQLCHKPDGLLITAPKTKFAKVMFLHLSVSHSVHRGHAWQEGMHGRGACVAGGHAWQGHAWQGACIVMGHALQGGHVWQGEGVCMAGRMHARGHAWCGVHATHASSPKTPRDMVSQCMGGMHPTGMHSYSII